MTSNTSRPAGGRISLDSRVTDRFLLRTVVGVEPYLAEDIASRGKLPARHVRVGPGYVEFQYEGPLKALETSRLFSSGGPVVAEGVTSDPPEFDVVVSRLRESCRSGVLRRVAGRGGSPIRFRVADVGEWRWPLRDALAAQLGWLSDPSRWDVNLEVVGGYLVGEVGALHYAQRIRALKRQPVSTTPVIAAVLCRLAKLTGTHRVFDPFCGSGTILFDAAFWTDQAVLGADNSRQAVGYATENLSGSRTLLLSDAAHCPLRSASIDRIISNLPFGKQVGSHENNAILYPAVLAEIERLLVPAGRVVLLTDDKRLLREAVERSKLKLLRERVLESGGATPSAFVLGFRRSKHGAGHSGQRRDDR